MKKLISLILSFILIVSLLSACSSGDTPESVTEADEASTIHTLYFKDSSKSEKVTATFFNSDSGESEDVKMEKLSEDDDSFTFSCEADRSVYNMAYITFDDNKTKIFAFNRCTSGWYNTGEDLLPYFEGEEPDYDSEFDDVKLSAYGYDKWVHIRTPDDYDPSSDEKYSTVYVLDGQGFVFLNENGQKLKGCPLVEKQAEIMASVTGKKAIVVAIESNIARDYELVPDIGESMDEKYYKAMHGDDAEEEYECMSGIRFASFAAETLVPYIQENYNVYTDALHTSITGASLGGLEAFYMAMEYPEVFGTTGAISPSFWMYDDDTWADYLGEKSFGEDSPFIYIYSGGENDVNRDDVVTKMVERIKNVGYPEEKLAFHYNEEGIHDSTVWRNIYSEFLEATAFRHVDVLQK